MRPMLARPYGPKYNTFPCFIQPKLNGIRALYQDGTFQSRDEKLWKPRVLAHIVEQMEVIQPFIGSRILDGEFYHHGWRLQRINGAIAVNRTTPIDDTYHIEYHIFDVVDPEKNFSERFIELYCIIRGHNLPSVRVVPTFPVWLKEEIDMHFRKFVSEGFEGIMLRPDLPYEIDKRSKALWKYKSWEDGEYECIAVTQGEGKAAIGIGALVLNGKSNLSEHCFNVGTGFSDEDRISLAANPPIGKLVKVRYPYLSEDGIPQCPSFLMVIE